MVAKLVEGTGLEEIAMRYHLSVDFERGNSALAPGNRMTECGIVRNGTVGNNPAREYEVIWRCCASHGHVDRTVTFVVAVANRVSEGGEGNDVVPETRASCTVVAGSLIDRIGGKVIERGVVDRGLLIGHRTDCGDTVVGPGATHHVHSTEMVIVACRPECSHR